MALTQDIIITFLLERGGKVKNSELVNKFKVLINSGGPAEKKEKRDLFKRLVNNVAVVKQVDDVKYVVVKKKYQGLVKGETIMDNSLFDLKSPRRHEIQNADIFNNNCYAFSTQSVGNASKRSCIKCDRSEKREAESVHPDGTVRVLTVSNNVRSGQTGSVFALVAIKSPPKCDETKNTHHKTTNEDSSEVQVMSERTLKLQATDYQKGAFRSTRTKRKELEAHGSPQLRRCNKITRPGSEAKYTDVIPLEPMEHEWLVKSAKGCWSQIHDLLLRDPQLAEKRNFMSGFTILHWAAKSGNGEMVCKVIDIARQSDGGINVNAKSYDGYTPLHIAAIHNHERVLSLLVCQYGANINVRDNSGKKPYHCLSQDVSLEIRKMLGDPQILRQNALCHMRGGPNLQDFPKGFNTLSKLFQPHAVGHKKKYRRRQSFHFISDDH